ncbi:MAG: hypothetical protein M3162_09755 [Thermoproteota archaeon]|nr:hypothetical protein [Thermoproteota archaeon]
MLVGRVEGPPNNNNKQKPSNKPQYTMETFGAYVSQYAKKTIFSHKFSKHNFQWYLFYEQQIPTENLEFKISLNIFNIS